MTFPNFRRRALFTLVALAALVSLSIFAFAKPTLQDSKGGVHHSATGQTLRVTVLLNGSPVANATVEITTHDGTHAAGGRTGDDGVFVTDSLDGGDFIVTASSGDNAARGNVTLEHSDDPAELTLNLAAK